MEVNMQILLAQAVSVWVGTVVAAETGSGSCNHQNVRIKLKS